MQIEQHEWALLTGLRERFLGGRGEKGVDYWANERLCELYDETFAQRIAWKWRAVWGELALRERMPRASRIVDWGCGSGIAAREYDAALSAQGDEGPRHFHLWDRSAAASAFAAKMLAQQSARAVIERKLPPTDVQVDLLLVSHVLGELSGDALDGLLELARRSSCVVWVEPGNRELSRELMALRDTLLPGRAVLGPCTHSENCGLAGRERDWCHSFARPAPEVFTRADWREFSRRMKIDLRSVPYAYFALADPGTFRSFVTRSLPSAPSEPLAGDAASTVRILGRPRLEKGHAKIDACDASGVRTLRVLERDAKPMFKKFEEPWHLARTFRVTVEGERVRSIEP